MVNCFLFLWANNVVLALHLFISYSHVSLSLIRRPVNANCWGPGSLLGLVIVTVSYDKSLDPIGNLRRPELMHKARRTILTQLEQKPLHSSSSSMIVYLTRIDLKLPVVRTTMTKDA